jgi:hypothetical protein
MADDVMQKLGTALKTWLPIVITIGGLIVGYFVFKAETRHQFELQNVHVNALRLEVQQLKADVAENRRDWQRNIEQQINELRETDIRQDMRIKVLENQPLSD